MKLNIPVRVILCLLVSLIVRAIVVYLKHPGFPPGWGGEIAQVAHSLAAGYGYASPYGSFTGPTSLVPPVYTYLLSVIFSVFGFNPTGGAVACGFNVLFSSLVVFPLFQLGKKLVDERAGLLAVVFWTLFPLSGYTEAFYVWSSSFYTLLLTSFLALTVSLKKESGKKNWAIYGALTSFLILTEPVCLTAVGVAYLWLMIRRFPLKQLILAGAIAAVLPSLWLVRNAIEMGDFVFLRSGFGLELSRGVRNYELAGQEASSLPNRNREEYERYLVLGEIDYMKARRAEAVEWIKNNPNEYAGRVVKRSVAFWSGRYQANELFWFYKKFRTAKSLVYSLPVIGALLGLMLMFRRRQPAVLLAGGILLFYPLIYYITHVELRQRAPIEPLLWALTAGFTVMLWASIWKKEGSEGPLSGM